MPALGLPAVPLALPTLGEAVPTEYRRIVGSTPLYTIAAALIDHGIARPDQWLHSDRDPLEFTTAVLREWTDAHMRPTPQTYRTHWFSSQLGRFDSDLSLRTGRGNNPLSSHTFYITVEPNVWYQLILGPTLAMLDREAGAEAARTFYQLIVDATQNLLYTIEPDWVQEWVEQTREFYDDEEEETTDLQDVQWPAWFEKTTPLKAEGAPRLLARIREPLLRTAFERALRLHELADRASPDPLYKTPYGDAFDDAPLFALSIGFEQFDAVHAYADTWSDTAHEVSRPPSNVYTLDIRDPKSVATAFHRYGAFCEATAILSWLCDTLPDTHPDA